MKKLFMLLVLLLITSGFAQILADTGVTTAVDEFEGYTQCQHLVVDYDATAYGLTSYDDTDTVFWEIAVPYSDVGDAPFHLIGSDGEYGTILVKVGETVHELDYYTVDPIESIGNSWYQLVNIPMDASFIELIVRSPELVRIRFRGPTGVYDFTFTEEVRAAFSSQFFIECPLPGNGS